MQGTEEEEKAAASINDHPFVLATAKDNVGRVVVGEYYFKDSTLGSRLMYRFMFAELVGTMLMTAIFSGILLSVSVVEEGESSQDLQSSSNILIRAIGQGFVLTALCFQMYSYLNVQYRFEDEKFKVLGNEERRVIVRANNIQGWVKGELVDAEADPDAEIQETRSFTREGTVTVRVERTNSVIRCLRSEIRGFLRQGDVALTVEHGELVEILSEKLSSLRAATYDVRYVDGTHGKESVWNLYLPRRKDYTVGHFNPAISYAAALLGDLEPSQAAIYIIAQCFGACLGSALIVPIVNDLGTDFPKDTVAQTNISDDELFRVDIFCQSLSVLIALVAFVSPWARKGQIRHPFFAELGVLALGIGSMVLCVVAASTMKTSPFNLAMTMGNCFASDSYSHLTEAIFASWLAGIFAAFFWAAIFSGEGQGVQFSMSAARRVLSREPILHVLLSAGRALLALVFGGNS